jgi:hypothetical protein
VRGRLVRLEAHRRGERRRARRRPGLREHPPVEPVERLAHVGVVGEPQRQPPGGRGWSPVATPGRHGPRVGLAVEDEAGAQAGGSGGHGARLQGSVHAAAALPADGADQGHHHPGGQRQRGDDLDVRFPAGIVPARGVTGGVVTAGADPEPGQPGDEHVRVAAAVGMVLPDERAVGGARPGVPAGAGERVGHGPVAPSATATSMPGVVGAVALGVGVLIRLLLRVLACGVRVRGAAWSAILPGTHPIGLSGRRAIAAPAVAQEQ